MNIKIPLYFLSSMDDSIYNDISVPLELSNNSNIILHITRYGGHVAHVDKRFKHLGFYNHLFEE